MESTQISLCFYFQIVVIRSSIVELNFYELFKRNDASSVKTKALKLGGCITFKVTNINCSFWLLNLRNMLQHVHQQYQTNLKFIMHQ